MIGPWGRSQVGALLACWTAGLAGIAVGWWGTSGRSTPGDQAAWVGLAAAGVVAFGAGVGLWVMAGRRVLGLRQARLFAAAVAPVGAAGTTKTSQVVSGGPAGLPVSSGMSRYYHRANCLLVRGKALIPAGVDHHRRDGRRPCGVCRP